MRGDEQVIEVLNEVLTAELTAINQYFVDAKMCENWGYNRLAAKFRADSIDEMKDAEELIDRILYLEGVPNLQRLGTVKVGEAVPEKLRLALEVESEAIGRLNTGIGLCSERGITDHESSSKHPRRRRGARRLARSAVGAAAPARRCALPGSADPQLISRGSHAAAAFGNAVRPLHPRPRAPSFHPSPHR